MSLLLAKKVFPLTLLLLLITGCSLSKYADPNFLTAVNFNNRLVEVINPLQEAMVAMDKAYAEAVPTTITADSKIDVTQMEAAFDETDGLATKAEEIKVLKSQNEEQGKQVLASYKVYLEKLDAYLDQYDAVLLFYKSGEYKSNAGEATTLQAALTDAYKQFGEQHNQLVDLLGSFRQ